MSPRAATIFTAAASPSPGRTRSTDDLERGAARGAPALAFAAGKRERRPRRRRSSGGRRRKVRAHRRRRSRGHAVKRKPPKNGSPRVDGIGRTDSFTLYYRPAGHADAFLVAWLTTAGKLAEPICPSKRSRFFAQLADPQAGGSLHQVPHASTPARGKMRVQWLPEEAIPKRNLSPPFATPPISVSSETPPAKPATRLIRKPTTRNIIAAKPERWPSATRQQFQSNFCAALESSLHPMSPAESGGRLLSSLPSLSRRLGARRNRRAETRLRPLLGKK